MDQGVLASEGKRVWCKAGEVTVTEISGTHLANTRDVICVRARGRRDKISPIKPGLAGSRGSEMVALHMAQFERAGCP